MTQKQFEKIINIVSASFGVSREEILSNRRTGRIAMARHVVYRSLTHMGLNLSETGKMMRRDHATVRHGIITYQNMYETDEIFRAKAQGIRERLKQYAYEE